MLEEALRLRERLWRADMHPVAVEAHAEQPPLGERPVPEQVQGKGAVGAVSEQALVAERHAGKGEGHHLFLGAPRQTPIRRHGKVALAAIAEARTERRE